MTGAAVKTGSQGRPWVVLEPNRPPRVPDVEDYWLDPPPDMSERCAYWVRQFARGWAPNRRVRRENYYGAAAWYGVYIWEWRNVISPLQRVGDQWHGSCGPTVKGSTHDARRVPPRPDQ